MRGFAPARRGEECGVSPPHGEVLLFRQKDPKPLAPVRGPSGAFAPVPTVRAAELASLKQSSPPNRIRDRGAAPPAGAMRWRQKLARSFFPRPLGEGRVRAILAASSSRIRCRPYYNDGEAQPRPQAPGHGAGYEDQLQRHWIPDNTGSPIRSSITNVEDRRRGQASGIVHVHSFVDRMKG